MLQLFSCQLSAFRRRAVSCIDCSFSFSSHNHHHHDLVQAKVLQYRGFGDIILLCDRCWIAKNKIKISPESSQRQRLESEEFFENRSCPQKLYSGNSILNQQNKQMLKPRNSTLHSVNPGTCTPLCDACCPLMLCSGAVASLQWEPLYIQYGLTLQHHLYVMLYVVLLETPCARSHTSTKDTELLQHTQADVS